MSFWAPRQSLGRTRTPVPPGGFSDAVLEHSRRLPTDFRSDCTVVQLERPGKPPDGIATTDERATGLQKYRRERKQPGRPAQGRCNCTHQLRSRPRNAIGHVECASGGARGVQAGNDCGSEIVDTDKAAPVAYTRQRKRQSPVDRRQQRPEVRLDAGAIDERRPQDRDLQAAAHLRQRLFRRKLGCCICIPGARWCGLCKSIRSGLFAKDLRGAQEDEAPDTGCNCVARQFGRSVAVFGEVRRRIRISWSMDPAGEMHNRVDPLEKGFPVSRGRQRGAATPFDAIDVQRTPGSGNKLPGCRFPGKQRACDETGRPGNKYSPLQSRTRAGLLGAVRRATLAPLPVFEK